MLGAPHFPETVSLKVKAVVKALVKFFSTFWLPKNIQTDQGSLFIYEVFAQVMSEFSVKHQAFSAYYLKSQGALESFHQTFKPMLCKYCVESNREWDEGLPLLLFAIC